MRFQFPQLKQLWHVWYDSDLATCLQNNGIVGASGAAITTDLHALKIIILNDLGRLTGEDLEDMQWADRTKLLIWRLRNMVRRFPDKRGQTVSVDGGAAGVVYQDMNMKTMLDLLQQGSHLSILKI